MRWFGWFRRRPVVDEYVGRHRPGSWGTIALPPTDNEPMRPPATILRAPPPQVRAEPVQPEPAQPVEAEPAPAQPASAQAEQPAPDAAPPADDDSPRQRVRLGFADGTTVDLEDETRESAAFRRAASRMIDDPR